MASKVPNGFTLIELIVSIAILLLLVLGLIASYNNFNQSQQVGQAARTVKASLKLGQSKALSGLKPASGCTELRGYTVSFTGATYSMQALCSEAEGLVGATVNLSLPANISFSPVPGSFTFGVVTRGLLGVTSPVTITITGFGKTYTLTVEPNGVVTDGGFQ